MRVQEKELQYLRTNMSDIEKQLKYLYEPSEDNLPEGWIKLEGFACSKEFYEKLYNHPIILKEIESLPDE